MARFGLLASLLSALFTLLVVEAVPFNTTVDGLSPVARDINSRAVIPSGPVWVSYFDRFISSTSLPAVSDVSGFNVFALSFIYSASLQDNAANWALMDATTRTNTKAAYAAAGISIIVSAYGAGPNPTSAGDDPTAAANYISNYVKTYGLDGVDVDYEDFGAIETAGTAVAWLTTFTKAIRAQLPQGQYILTHAPVAPWFSPGLWPGNGYLGVHAAVGSMIDWYNIQFYNQGVTEYTSCSGLLTSSSSQWPQSAVFQIAASGVPLNKIVIGKPAAAGDATNGYVDPGTLAGCLAQAKSSGWSAGAMTWQYPDGNSAWITQVRAQSFPVGSSTGGGTTTSPNGGGGTTTTTTTTTSTTPSGGSCSGAVVWNSSDAYPAGSVVTFNGALWTANQWNEAEAPGGASGAWDRTATCNAALEPATAAGFFTGHAAAVAASLTGAPAAKATN
ncbi:glycoside hydrolase family 18 protein [Roridomyces roridus]|uniref:Glycoside hydrolase family 18 protein n=1 Tax=Roridomyces roridus TaxID=1738132 RepID=A0AAD7FLQ9_9AGAR|nr:glycoside hydrolase family 18 protein [Roridomyces roridus]